MVDRALSLEALEEARPVSPARRLALELRDHLPIWFVYLEAIGLLHATLANFPASGFASVGISRPAFALTILFPMAWFVLYFGLRIRASGVARPWRWAVLAFAALGVPVLVVLGYRPYPLDHGQLTSVFEVSQFAWVGLFAVQILATRGLPSLLEFFGVTLLYGLILENTGIVMHFFYEPSFRVYAGPLPAPVCTVLGWSVVFYVVISLIERLSAWLPWLAARAWRQAVAATLLALSLDLQLDPMASMSGVFWRWNERLPAAFLGVPAINFAAWAGAFLPFAFFRFQLQRRPLGPYERSWELFLRVPLAAFLGGALCFAIMTVLEGGFGGPSVAILADFCRKLLPY